MKTMLLKKINKEVFVVILTLSSLDECVKHVGALEKRVEGKGFKFALLF